MMQHRSFSTLVIIACVIGLAGCAKTVVQPVTETEKLGLPRPPQVLVYTFAVSPTEVIENQSIIHEFMESQGDMTPEQRLREIGTLQAVGFSAVKIRALFVAEGLVLAVIGSLLGLVGAVLYGYLILIGLRTWWIGAVGTTLLTLHVSTLSLLLGGAGGILAAVICIVWTLRRLGRASTRSLLTGTLERDWEKGRWGKGEMERREAPQPLATSPRLPVSPSPRLFTTLRLAHVLTILAALLLLAAFLLPGREPIEEQLQAHLPLLPLLLDPLVKASFLAQPEAVKEGAAHQVEGLLDLGNQGGALRLRRGRGEPLGRCISLLHHLQVQRERRLRVQAEEILFGEQMAGRSRGVGIGQQAAQQRDGIAQGLARLSWLAVGPQQSSELAARMHAPFDGQVEQQGLRLAQGKGEAAPFMKDFGRAEHVQT